MNNNFTNHPLQSSQWGEFRKKTGINVIQKHDFQVTIHKIPYTPWTIGYLPKGQLPDEKMINELKKIGEQERCIFIQLEPNVKKNSDFDSPRARVDARRCEAGFRIPDLALRPAAHPLFTKYTFQLDLTKSEEELLKNMHPKTRYNIKIAKKHNVQIIEDNSDEAFETYLKLLKETTTRQKFYAHDENYHRLMWETLRSENRKDSLTAHLFLAKYNSEVLAAWMLFVFKDTLYYPYGTSSTEHREVMASNLMMWEAIRFGKKLGLKTFDMWGALGPNPNPNDPWYGFNRFKEGYGPKLVEFVGSYDLVISPLLYYLYRIANKIRWILLKHIP